MVRKGRVSGKQKRDERGGNEKQTDKTDRIGENDKEHRRRMGGG